VSPRRPPYTFGPSNPLERSPVLVSVANARSDLTPPSIAPLSGAPRDAAAAGVGVGAGGVVGDVLVEPSVQQPARTMHATSFGIAAVCHRGTVRSRTT